MLEQAQVPGLSSTHTNPLMSQPEVNFNVRKLVFWGGGGLGFCLLTTGDISIKQNSTSKCGTLRVKARPSRPSGNKTVNNFLSSLTTTLQDYMSDY